VFEARQKYRDRADLLLLLSTYWLLGGKPHEADAAIEQTQMGHACEWETSMMLRIRPDLVGNLAEVAPVEFGDPFLPASRGWITKDRTVPGHIGAPRSATAEKGETIFRVFSDDVSHLLRRVLAWDGQSWSG
jgi:creatinine amidohydrolase